jgi:(2Fe-2S) ferredoxin
VQPDGIWYCDVTPESILRIAQQHLAGGEVVEELVFHRGPAST